LLLQASEALGAHQVTGICPPKIRNIPMTWLIPDNVLSVCNDRLETYIST